MALEVCSCSTLGQRLENCTTGFEFENNNKTIRSETLFIIVLWSTLARRYICECENGVKTGRETNCRPIKMSNIVFLSQKRCNTRFLARREN